MNRPRLFFKHKARDQIYYIENEGKVPTWNIKYNLFFQENPETEIRSLNQGEIKCILQDEKVELDLNTQFKRNNCWMTFEYDDEEKEGFTFIEERRTSDSEINSSIELLF